MSSPLVLLEVVASALQGELIRQVLSAAGVPCELSAEASGDADNSIPGPQGSVELLVPPDRLAEARQILQEYYSGKTPRGSTF